jgi:hypothetical protein
MATLLFWTTYAALWTIVVVLFAAVFFLYRHIGQGLLESREGRASQGPKVGARLPSVRLQTLDRTPIHLGESRSRPRLLFFASSTCEPCRRALEPLASFAQQHRATLDTVFVCGGRTEQEVTQLAASLPTSVCVVADTRWILGSRLRISSTPFALVTDTESIVRGKGMPTTPEEFEWFIEQLELASGIRPSSVTLGSTRPASRLESR